MIIKYPDPTVLKFTVPGKPQGKGRPRNNPSGGKPYTPDKTRDYEDRVKWLYRQAHPNISFGDDEALNMHIVAYCSITARTGKSERANMLSGDIKPTGRPDGDNILKIVADSLNGMAYKDDAQITTASVVKIYSDNPRVEVSLGVDYTRKSGV